MGNENYEKVMKETAEMPLQEGLEYILDNYCTEETFKIGNQKPVDTFRELKSIGEGNVKAVSDMDSEELIFLYEMPPIPGSIASYMERVGGLRESTSSSPNNEIES